MIRSHLQKLSIVSLGFWLTIALSYAKPITDLSKGAPKYMDQQLPKSSYVEVSAHKLAHAKVVWVNFELLHELGIDVPAEGLTSSFEKQILDAFAWAVPNSRDAADKFTSEKKVLYADRYGGNGLGVNFGSGRAASAGEVQIKGVGVTPLVGEGQTFDHAHGGASMEESIREAIWGEVNNQELPWGANRIVAIIDTGTATKWSDGGEEPRALIVRMDPPRPAWFARARFGYGSLRNDDEGRTRSAIEHIDQALPADPAAKTQEERIQSGFKNYVDRMADQYAAAYARGLYHGATSISNFQIDGKYIDYGTQTSQAGFAPIKILDHVEAFGDVSSVTDTLIREFHQAVMTDAPENIKGMIPSESELSDRFKKRYSLALQREMLLLTGAPEKAVERVLQNSAAGDLYATISEMAKKGLEKSKNVDKEDPVVLGTYDMRNVLTLAAESGDSEPSLQHALKNAVPSDEDRATFISRYLNFKKEIEQAAQSDGVTQ
jgi:hypothetical protein